MSTVRPGGCACAAIRYELLGDGLDVSNCRCRMCQRSVGATTVTWASVSAERLRFTRGEPAFWASSESAERGFCARCGTSLLTRGIGGEPIFKLSVASLDDPELKPDRTPGVTPEEAPQGVVLRDGPDVDVIQLGDLFHAVGFGRSSDPGSLRAMLDGSRWVVSAWRGDRLIGFCRAVSDGVSSAYLTSVAVLPEHQRQGIGRAMMDRILEGKPTVKFVLHTSPAGRALYRAVGFQDGGDYMLRPRLVGP